MRFFWEVKKGGKAWWRGKGKAVIAREFGGGFAVGLEVREGARVVVEGEYEG